MVEAAIEGLGIAFVPEPCARDDLAAERLIRLLDEWSPLISGLCLYYASRRHVPAPLQAFIYAIKDGAAENAGSRGIW